MNNCNAILFGLDDKKNDVYDLYNFLSNDLKIPSSLFIDDYGTSYKNIIDILNNMALNSYINNLDFIWIHYASSIKFVNNVKGIIPSDLLTSGIISEELLISILSKFNPKTKILFVCDNNTLDLNFKYNWNLNKEYTITDNNTLLSNNVLSIRWGRNINEKTFTSNILSVLKNNINNLYNVFELMNDMILLATNKNFIENPLITSTFNLLHNLTLVPNDNYKYVEQIENVQNIKYTKYLINNYIQEIPSIYYTSVKKYLIKKQPPNQPSEPILVSPVFLSNLSRELSFNNISRSSSTIPPIIINNQEPPSPPKSNNQPIIINSRESSPKLNNQQPPSPPKLNNQPKSNNSHESSPILNNREIPKLNNQELNKYLCIKLTDDISNNLSNDVTNDILNNISINLLEKIPNKLSLEIASLINKIKYIYYITNILLEEKDKEKPQSKIPSPSNLLVSIKDIETYTTIQEEKK